MPKTSAWGLGLALVLIARAASAQTPSDTLPKDTAVFSLGELVVPASRAAATPGGASALVVRLDSLRLAPAPTLEDVLRQVPLVRVRRNPRGEVELALRGGETRQVAVLVDGVPLTLGWDHRADLAAVPMGAAQSVTLARGLPSVLAGPNVLGGVVEVGIARAAAGTGRAGASLRGGSALDHLGGRSFELFGATPLERTSGRWLVRAGAGWRDRRGFALPAGVVDGGDGERRQNSDLEQIDGFFAVRYRGAEGRWLSLSTSGYAGELGVPAELHLSAPRYWRYPGNQRLLAALSGGTGQRKTPWGQGDVEASFGVDVAHRRIDGYEGPGYRQVLESEISDDRTLTARLLADHTLGERGELRGALTLADVRRDERLEPGGTAEYSQRLWSLGGEVAWPIPGARLAGGRLSLGAALDGADTPQSGDKPPRGRMWTWGARAGVSAVAGGAALLHAGASRRARFPSLRELYSGALGRFEPNPGLRPEVLSALEAGVTTKLQRLDLQLVAFHHRLEDAIVRVGLGDGRFQRVNRDEVRSSGLELLAGWKGRLLSVAGDLTLQRVRVAADGGGGRGEYQPAVSGGVDVGIPLPLELRAEAGGEFVGRQWCVHPEQGRDVPLEASTRFDARLARTWGRATPGGWAPRIETLLELENAGDAVIYDQCGLPQPGRTLRVQLRVR
ncbi:MAG: TonB-dependent receptor [Gemmatimonadetes bacterium]|nr:TonB-dependent receptor [Gemmatimonadota bacterium]